MNTAMHPRICYILRVLFNIMYEFFMCFTGNYIPSCLRNSTDFYTEQLKPNLQMTETTFSNVLTLHLYYKNIFTDFSFTS
jgi:hypothetical protein